MTTLPDSYRKYARASLANHAKKDAASRYLLYNAVKDQPIERVLDIGCGAGQDLLQFLEKTAAFCIGIDIEAELGQVTGEVFENEKRVAFVRSEGEKLPFTSESFDVVLCRVALPYMDNAKAIGEVARVLKANGVFLLKTHTPRFYFAMIRKGLETLNVKNLIFPTVCLVGSVWHLVIGRKLKNGIWKGKEVFQTQRYLKKQFNQNGLKIVDFLSDDNPISQSYRIVKM